MKPCFIVADLFSGAGGLSLGFKMTGFKLVFALDVDWDAIYTYVKNNPEASWICKDIRKVSVREILEVADLKKGEPDVLVAGIPCEGYSMLNRRYDPSDPRNYLFLEFIRIAKALKPKAILIENVPGLLRRANGAFKHAIEKSLKRLGYSVTSFELNALNYGIPQKRTRIFFVGLTSNKKFIPPPPTHGKRDIEILSYFANQNNKTQLRPYLTVWDAISDLPPLRPGEKKERYEVPPMTEYQKILRKGASRLYNHEAPRHPNWTVELIAKTKPGEPIYGTFKQRIRLKWDEPAPTTPAGGARPQWFFAHPEQPRGLTVREKARLQSFPDWYIFYGSIIKQRILVGDAVPPLLAKILAQRLLEYLQEL